MQHIMQWLYEFKTLGTDLSIFEALIAGGHIMTFEDIFIIYVAYFLSVSFTQDTV